MNPMGLTLSNPCAIVSHQKLDPDRPPALLSTNGANEETTWVKTFGAKASLSARFSLESTKRREDDDATYGWVSKSGCPFRRVNPFEKKS